jgi:cephalosporin hydroxylase
VLVLLNSGHTRDHVLAELRAYGPLVSPGSYIVAMDGIMEQIAGAPRTHEDWAWNNPRQAVREFLEEDDRFSRRSGGRTRKPRSSGCGVTPRRPRFSRSS